MLQGDPPSEPAGGIRGVEAPAASRAERQPEPVATLDRPRPSRPLGEIFSDSPADS